MMVLLPLIGLICLLGWYSKWATEIISTIAIAYILVVGCGILPSLLLHKLEVEYFPNVNPKFQQQNAIVLLGAGKIKPLLSNYVFPSSQAYSRIFEATRLYSLCKKAHKDCTIIITGGNAIVDGNSEAEVYQRALLQVGIDANDMVLETKSMNTYENAKFTTPLLHEKKYENIFLVTSAIHLKRALLYFSDFGIEAIPCAADAISARWSFIPLAYNFALTDFALHEYMGIIQYYFNHRLSSILSRDSK
jgi:uncharacterized SAM-binding protein YcdF (DUF218 family)